jgi:uncharacterized membrane protein
MKRPPDYIVHQVDEKDVTVDWFFARGRGRHRTVQFILVVVGWFFAVLPVVITVSALVYEDDPQKGWWNYREGFNLWDLTMLILGFLIVVFIIGFAALFLINRASAKERNRRKTYNAARLSRRLELAAGLYQGKYGAEAFRLEQKRIAIQPYQDLETYELRDRYREYGVD